MILDCLSVEYPIGPTFGLGMGGGGLRYSLLRRYVVTEPNEGWLYIFNPNLPTLSDTADSLATLIYYLKDPSGSFTITQPSGGWVRELNITSKTLGNVADVVATLIEDIQNESVEAYTLTGTHTTDKILDPNITTILEVANVLATLITDLKTIGLIS